MVPVMHRNAPFAPTVLKMVAKVVKLASLPAVCTRVMQLADDPRASAQQIAEVICLDPGLAARMLKLANSAHFGMRERVDTFDVAIRVLGVDALRTLVLGTGAVGALNALCKGVLDTDAFWANSVHCALTARELWRLTRHPRPEQGFVIGLLHAIGQIVLAVQDASKTSLIVERLVDARQDRAGLEREIFGFTYAEVGAALLSAWQLPASLSCPVRFQLNPNSAAACATEAAILHIAMALTSFDIGRQTQPEQHEGSILAVQRDVWRLAGVVEDTAMKVLDDVDSQWFEVMEIVAPGSLLLHY